MIILLQEVFQIEIKGLVSEINLPVRLDIDEEVIFLLFLVTNILAVIRRDLQIIIVIYLQQGIDNNKVALVYIDEICI